METSWNSSSNSQRKFQPLSLNQLNQDLTPAPSETFCSAYGQRQWLKNRGKEQFINFSEHALSELRKYFDSLDEKQNGSIGVEELQDPFIAFGLSDSRQEVEELIKSVDLDGSGKIEFDQFLDIMLKIKRGKSNGSDKNSAMFDFFQKLSKGNLGDGYDKNMSFKLNVSQFRRKKILQSIMERNKEEKEKGIKIMQNFRKQVVNTPKMRETLQQSKKSNVYLYGFESNPKKRQ